MIAIRSLVFTFIPPLLLGLGCETALKVGVRPPQPTDSRPARNGLTVGLIQIPDGTSFSVKLAHDLTTSELRSGDAWDGILIEDIVVTGKTIWRSGTRVQGIVTQSSPIGPLGRGPGVLGIKVTQLGQERIDTAAFVEVGATQGARNTNFIAGGAALGALLGFLSNAGTQDDQAMIGAAAGAASGTDAAATSTESGVKIPASQAVPFNILSFPAIAANH